MDSLIGNLTLKLLGIAVALAAEIAPFSADQPQVAIQYWANFYHISYIEFYLTLQCESGFNPAAVGKLGEQGIAQIYLPAHPDVTKEQALDPDWSLQWAASHFDVHAHWWTCHHQFE